MKQLNKIRICLILNVSVVSFISYYITNFAENSKYFRFGPHEDFIFISVPIDTNEKYISLLVLNFFNDLIRVLVQEIGEPILGFTVYNPDKKDITEFTKSQLYFYANSIYFVNNIRYIFNLLINITQIDIALFSILIEQIVSGIVIYFLLNEKRFINEKNLLSNTHIEMVEEV